MIFCFAAKEDRDFVEVFCGDARRRYLGYPVNDSPEGGQKDLDPTPAVDPDTGPQHNATIGGSKTGLSDMGKIRDNFF